jgi:hypothetical protein
VPTNPSLRVTDFNDREILRIVEDEADYEGWTDLSAVAERVLPTHMRATKARRESAIRCTASRLNYMRFALGIVDRRIIKGPPRETQWRVTKKGEVYLVNRLSPDTRKSISQGGAGALVEYAQLISTRYVGLDDLPATMIRRQFQFGQGQRRR